jgi:imidazoleglycerol phosphate synthase glutamine amidotransferase subunit HisH
MITIVDYGMGNLRNVVRACEAVGEKAQVTADQAVIASAEKLILPGVGAFGEAIRRIDGLGLRESLIRHAGWMALHFFPGKSSGSLIPSKCRTSGGMTCIRRLTQSCLKIRPAHR